MLTYLAGVLHLPGDRGPTTRIVYPPLTAAERRRTGVLLGVIALTVLPNIAYPMIWNVGILWADQNASLATPLGAIPASWRSAERRVGQECVSTCRSWWSPYMSKKKHYIKHTQITYTYNNN